VVVTLTQTLVPDAMRGRTNSAMNTAFTAATVAAMVGPSPVIAVCMRRSIDLVVTLLAVLKSGAAYVPARSRPCPMWPWSRRARAEIDA